MAGQRILVVDDEPGVRTALENILADEGYVVATAASGEDGLSAAETEQFDAILLDIWLPGIDGIETLVRLKERQVDSEIVMISGHGTIETAVKATRLGAFDFIEKPLALEKILLVLRNALRQRRLETRNRRLLEQLDRDTELLGRSAAAERLRAEVVAAASSDAPVLVSGERGSGREMVARRIHATSRRSGGAFVDLPCAALDSESAALALFGRDAEPGRLSLADGGSLFLDQVEVLDAAVQNRLAAALRRRDAGVPDVRLIASAASEPGPIAPELRQLLDVVRIKVPPLRVRREDIGLLAERFVRDLSREYGRPEKKLAPECLSAMTAYGWPGNVRELRNLVEGLLLLAPGEVIRAEDLPAELGGGRTAAEDLYREFRDLAEGLETFERYYIRRMLVAERGELSACAKRLGLSTKVLEKRMGALGLAPPRQ